VKQNYSTAAFAFRPASFSSIAERMNLKYERSMGVSGAHRFAREDLLQALGHGNKSFVFESPVKLRRELLRSLQLRRAVDGARGTRGPFPGARKRQAPAFIGGECRRSELRRRRCGEKLM
jgi:hypothetical protein